MKTAKIPVAEGKEAGMRNPTGRNSQVPARRSEGKALPGEHWKVHRVDSSSLCLFCRFSVVSLPTPPPRFNFGGFNSKISVFNVDSIYLLTTPKVYRKGNMKYSELTEKHNAKQNCGFKGV